MFSGTAKIFLDPNLTKVTSSVSVVLFLPPEKAFPYGLWGFTPLLLCGECLRSPPLATGYGLYKYAQVT
jgi:hypothetical protein